MMIAYNEQLELSSTEASMFGLLEFFYATCKTWLKVRLMIQMQEASLSHDFCIDVRK